MVTGKFDKFASQKRMIERTKLGWSSPKERVTPFPYDFLKL